MERAFHGGSNSKGRSNNSINGIINLLMLLNSFVMNVNHYLLFG